jgi:cytochrome d ubiquinol oxidase subunit I
MSYPVWEVPFLGSGWIVGIVAIIHIFLSHFAVGGGLFLPVMETYALKRKDEAMRQWLRKHARLFLIVTSVGGAGYGVGIWVVVALANPHGIGHLIHGFVLGWATEWIVFIAEMACATAYYYGWDRLSPERHVKVGWLYAISSWLTLAIINGIITFMLTPGKGWAESKWMWDGFFNATYAPSLVMRTLVMWSLAAVYAFWSAARIEDLDLKERVLRFASGWVLPAFVLLPLVGAWYFFAIPEGSRQLLQIGIAGAPAGNFSLATRVAMLMLMSTATIGFIVYFGPYRNGRSFTRGMAVAIGAVALMATGVSEWSREVARKPFVIRDVMYTSGVRVESVASYQKDGLLANSVWAREYASLGGDTPFARGEAVFRSLCMSCHTLDGYRSIKGLVKQRDLDGMRSMVRLLRSRDPKENTYLKFMPPLAASATEADELALYLHTISHPGAVPSESKTLTSVTVR